MCVSVIWVHFMHSASVLWPKSEYIFKKIFWLTPTTVLFTASSRYVSQFDVTVQIFYSCVTMASFAGLRFWNESISLAPRAIKVHRESDSLKVSQLRIEISTNLNEWFCQQLSDSRKWHKPVILTCVSYNTLKLMIFNPELEKSTK